MRGDAQGLVLTAGARKAGSEQPPEGLAVRPGKAGRHKHCARQSDEQVPRTGEGGGQGQKSRTKGKPETEPKYSASHPEKVPSVQDSNGELLKLQAKSY